MSDTSTEAPGGETESPGVDALQDAFLTYRDAGLRLPPVPRDLVDALREQSDNVYGTAPVDLFDVEAFLQAARDPATAPLVAFGHVGHGAASWWFCYQAITASAGVFIRLAYGGIDSSDDKTLGVVNRTLLLAEEVLVAAEAAAAKGALAKGRAVVVLDALLDSFVQLAPDGEVIQPDDPMADALARLRAL